MVPNWVPKAQNRRVHSSLHNTEMLSAYGFTSNALKYFFSHKIHHNFFQSTVTSKGLGDLFFVLYFSFALQNI